MNHSLQETNYSLPSKNFTSFLQYYKFHEDLYGNLHAKIIYFFVLLMTYIIGPILLSGIIIFEKKGGDPQKRNVINRLFSKALMNQIVFTSLVGLGRVCREMFGLIDFSIMIWVEYFGYIAVCNMIMFLNEMTVIKYLHIVVWKRVRGINDGFWAVTLSGITLCWSCWQCITDHLPNRMLMHVFMVNSAKFPGSIEDEK